MSNQKKSDQQKIHQLGISPKFREKKSRLIEFNLIKIRKYNFVYHIKCKLRFNTDA